MNLIQTYEEAVDKITTAAAKSRGVIFDQEKDEQLLKMKMKEEQIRQERLLKRQLREESRKTKPKRYMLKKNYFSYVTSLEEPINSSSNIASLVKSSNTSNAKKRRDIRILRSPSPTEQKEQINPVFERLYQDALHLKYNSSNQQSLECSQNARANEGSQKRPVSTRDSKQRMQLHKRSS